MRRTAWALVLLLTAACNGNDGSVGLRCDTDTGCPGGLICAEGRCAEPCTSDDECVQGDCSFGRCRVLTKDAGVGRDAGAKDAKVSGDAGTGSTACTGDTCQVPAPSCDGDELVTYVQTAECSNGVCSIEEIRSTCTNCDTNCRAACVNADCAATAGECSYGFCASAGTSVMCDSRPKPDGVVCSTGVCQSGQCSACSRDADCDDNNACTTDSCDTGTGTCTSVPADGGACDDGNACTEGDICQGGACTGGAPKDCSDNNPCTRDVCDGSTGVCSHPAQAEGGACDDGNACTMGETCQAGTCSSGSAVDCSDGNQCTDDICDPVTGCANPNNTASCDDGDLCTYNDRCASGTCGGTTVVCNDGDCVTRSCNGTATCTTNNAAFGTACSVDGNPCTDDFCNSTGTCIHPPEVAGTLCNSDGNPCTADICNSSGTCTHPAAADGSSCGTPAALRCCGGSCRDISTDESHCGGCNTACAAGRTCEPVNITTQCNPNPVNTSGRCTCQAANAECPRTQLCRTFTPYINRCTPNASTDCHSGIVEAIAQCPDFCRY